MRRLDTSQVKFFITISGPIMLIRLLVLIAIGFIMALWWNSSLARQLARDAAKNRCDKFGLRLIDDTVVRTGQRLARDDFGRAVFERTYHFEFSTDGSRRYGGQVITRGRHVQSIALDPYISAEDNAPRI